MILNTVHLCYNAIHQPFASEGAAEIGNLNSRRSASAIIRAVLRSEGIDTQEAIHYSIHKCKCHAHGPQQEGDGTDDILNPDLTLKQLGIQDGDSVFIRKVDAGNQGAQQVLPSPIAEPQVGIKSHPDEPYHYSSSGLDSDEDGDYQYSDDEYSVESLTYSLENVKTREDEQPKADAFPVGEPPATEDVGALFGGIFFEAQDWFSRVTPHAYGTTLKSDSQGNEVIHKTPSEILSSFFSCCSSDSIIDVIKFLEVENPSSFSQSHWKEMPFCNDRFPRGSASAELPLFFTLSTLPSLFFIVSYRSFSSTGPHTFKEIIEEVKEKLFGWTALYKNPLVEELKNLIYAKLGVGDRDFVQGKLKILIESESTPVTQKGRKLYDTIENLPDDLTVLSMIYIESTVKYTDDREAEDGDVEGLDLSELRLVQFFQKIHLEESEKDDPKFRFEVVSLIQVDQDKVAAQGFSTEIALRGLALATWIRVGEDFSLNIRAPSTAPHSFKDHFFPVSQEYVGILAGVDFGL